MVGILPKSFVSDPPADIWILFRRTPTAPTRGTICPPRRGSTGFALAAAQAEMKVLAERYRLANPKLVDPSESATAIPCGTP